MRSGLDRRAGSMATLTGGGAEAELADRSAAVVLRASGLQGTIRGVAGEKHKGKRGPRFHSGKKSWWRAVLPVLALR